MLARHNMQIKCMWQEIGCKLELRIERRLQMLLQLSVCVWLCKVAQNVDQHQAWRLKWSDRINRALAGMWRQISYQSWCHNLHRTRHQCKPEGKLAIGCTLSFLSAAARLPECSLSHRARWGYWVSALHSSVLPLDGAGIQGLVVALWLPVHMCLRIHTGETFCCLS